MLYTKIMLFTNYVQHSKKLKVGGNERPQVCHVLFVLVGRLLGLIGVLPLWWLPLTEFELHAVLSPNIVQNTTRIDNA